jgi:hypothetical protein
LVVRLDDANIHACLSTESVASTDSVTYAIGATSKPSLPADQKLVRQGAHD